MKLSGYKKLLLLGIILLIIAGIFVVALKGVNVSLYLHQHETITVKVGKAIELKDIEEICNSVFENKDYIAREVEMFSDSTNIIVESITDEEKEELINKINEKYETELTVQSLNINSNSNIRIRDIIRPFTFPVVIAVVLIGIVYAIIYRNKETIIKYIKTLGITIITEALIASIIAIVRIPLSQSIITLMLFISVAEIMICMNKNK